MKFKKNNKLALDKFINFCLYDKKIGYYMKKNPFGQTGDFTTAPNISRLFSEMIAVWTISFWENLGSKVTEMTPEHHDLVLAVTSHAPHLIAYTMVGVADDLAQVTNSEVINFSAAGFRDFTRIAASDPTMWRDVFLNNKEAALEVLGRFSEELFALNRAIRQGDGDFLFDYFTRTRSIRRGIIEAGQDTKAPNFGR